MEALDINGSITLKNILNKLEESMEWFDVAQDTETCLALVNALMIFIIHKMRGVS